MALIKRTTTSEWDSLMKAIEASKKGETNFIPNPYDRLASVFNLVQGRFSLIGADSGVGKSAFVDDAFLLRPWFTMLADIPEIKFEVLYYVMERNIESKISKWLSWLLYHQQNWLLSGQDLVGAGGRASINDMVFDKVKDLNEPFHQFTDRVHMYDGRISVDMIRKHINKKASELGVLYHADTVGVTKDGGNYIMNFSPDKVRELRGGTIEEYVELEHKGEKFTLTHNEHKYFYHNPNTYVFIVLDGVGLITTSHESTKRGVDSVTNILADARDIYKFSPVMVSQFNRGIADSNRVKHRGSDLAPQESDFKDSGGPYQAADLALGLFNPYKHKAYDKEGFYGGYDILSGMLSPQGHNRFRSLHVLKNSYGIDGVVTGMKFLGECGYFTALPKHDSSDLHKEYAIIAGGK